MDNLWWDCEDFTPGIICLCELSDGQRIEGIWTSGYWETLDGEDVIYPIKFKFVRLCTFNLSYMGKVYDYNI